MGIGGAELAMEMMGLEPELLWYSEIDKDASKVLAHHWPGVPNLGDLKLIDWATCPPVEILTAGYPCQPFSLAGHRKGTDDPRHLWPWIADALRILRPRVALFENVAAHLSLGFDTVLSDLAEIGFDADWTTFRASDVGACHRRDRLFIVARCGGGLTLLPTPAASLHNDGESLDSWTARNDRLRITAGNGNGMGTPLPIAIKQLLPTPTAQDAASSRNRTATRRTPPRSGKPVAMGDTLTDIFVPKKTA